MNMAQTFLIYKNTLQKEMRSKVLLFLLALTVVVLLLLSQILNIFRDQVTPEGMGGGNLGSVVMGLFMGLAGFWNFFLAVFLGVNTVRTDLENCVAAQLLSFPIKRFEYLISRILGVFTIVMVFYFLSTGLALLAFSRGPEFVFNHQGLLWAFVLNNFSLLAVVALAVFISLYGGKLTSLVSTYILVLLISLSNTYFQQHPLSSVFEDFSLFGMVGAFLHICVPRIGTINSVAGAIIAEQKVTVSLWMESGHYLLSFAFLLFAMTIFFSKKEI